MLKFLSLLLFFAANSHAEEFKTNYLTFNTAYRNVDVSHYENSGAANFVSLGEKSSIPVFSLRAGVEKEFFADSPLSVTAGLGGGAFFGRNKKDLVVRNLRFRDKVSGSFYSFGGTLNKNFTWIKLRGQVFGGFNLLKAKTDYKLSYSLINGSPPQINLDYEESSTQSYISAGLRLFDLKNEIFSIFSIEYQVTSSFTFSKSASKVNGSDTSITNPASVDHSPLIFNLGFGLQF